ncbi:kelch-like protein 17 isoform X1 [Artibeus jamaicensis]|uniref:kelch-like protein 17 isoform X1 n=1 Tax=Artibeus jamaicensis TaxID=9417 RepID=UPI00235A98B9|nr:kelch-like protein 17 isoform X1 [Artibeus jamaicensis]
MQPRSERPAGRTQSPEHGSPGPGPEASPPPPPQPPAPEAERARTRPARPTAPMEGAMQLLSREGHTVSHNSKRHYHDAFVAMSRMRQRGLLCDIVLHVAAKEIRAHKVVLASCSPYFHAMFTNEMSESRQTHVTLHDIDPQALDQLVQFAYTAEIVVGEGNVQTLLPAASLLQLNGVRDACCKFLLSQLDPSNCLGIRGFADTHSCSDLLKAAHRYVLQHFVDVAKTEEFMLLPLKQVLELVSSDSLNVPSEEDVYRAVLSWVKHDVDARRQHVPRLMKCVRLPLLSRDFLLGHVDAESLVRHHPDCKDLLIEALKFHLLPEQRGVLGTSRTRPRRCEGAGPVLFAVGGGSLFAIHGDCEAYDTRTDRWHVVASMSTRRARVGVAAVGNRLYAVGGYDGTSDLATVESYDPVTNTWQAEVSMGTRRSCLGVAVLHGLLYAAGGYDGASCLNSAERYDPLTGTWTSVAAMSTRRRYVRVAVLDGNLYAVGGYDSSSHLATVEKYEPQVNTWTPVASMLSRRSSAGVAVLEGALYVAGGNDGTSCLNSVERYSPKAGAWESVAPMNIRRCAVSRPTGREHPRPSGHGWMAVCRGGQRWQLQPQLHREVQPEDQQVGGCVLHVHSAQQRGRGGARAAQLPATVVTHAVCVVHQPLTPGGCGLPHALSPTGGPSASLPQPRVGAGVLHLHQGQPAPSVCVSVSGPQCLFMCVQSLLVFLFIQYLLIGEQCCSCQFLCLLWKVSCVLGPSCRPGCPPTLLGAPGSMGVDIRCYGSRPTQTLQTWRDQEVDGRCRAAVRGERGRPSEQSRPPAFVLHTALASPGKAPPRVGTRGFLPVDGGLSWRTQVAPSNTSNKLGQ